MKVENNRGNFTISEEKKASQFSPKKNQFWTNKGFNYEH